MIFGPANFDNLTLSKMDPNCQKRTQIVKNGSNCQKWADCQNQKSRALVAKLRDWWFSKQTLSKTWWLFMIIWSRIRGTQKRNFGTKLSQKCLPDIARSSSSDIIYLSVPDRRPGSDFPMWCGCKLPAGSILTIGIFWDCFLDLQVTPMDPRNSTFQCKKLP